MENVDERFIRLASIFTAEQMQKLADSHVAVIGLGGVGSYSATALARGGIGKLTICDFDTIEASNINRQEFAFESTLGMKKIDVCKKTLIDINPDIHIDKFDFRLDCNNVDEVCKNADYIIDAIDDVSAKIVLAKYAQDKQIPIVACMGTAMRIHPEMLEFADIYETSVCPLCKRVRKEAKNAGIKSLQVLYSKEPVIKSLDGSLGSTSFVPPIAGMKLAGFVFNTLIN